MGLKQRPVINPQMLIRKPVEEVYEALVDPAITTQFWFTSSSGRLAPGAHVRWEWEMYAVSTDVHVREMEPDVRILIEWSDPPYPVEFNFDARPDGTTLVRIVGQDFQGSDDEAVVQAIDSMGGFAWVLAALKAWLEHGIDLKLVPDHYPDAHVK